MRKLIMWNVMTLDGYFEESQNWDLSIHQTIWGQELEKFSIDQLKSADYLVFGRVTYEGMAAYWTTAEAETSELEVAKLMNSIPKLVFSKTLKTADWNNTTLISDKAYEKIQQLKSQDGKNMFVFGSANLSETFIQDNLFDEYRIAIAPVVLGTGRPLFKEGLTSNSLSLVSTQPLTTGGVILTYANSKI